MGSLGISFTEDKLDFTQRQFVGLVVQMSQDNKWLKTVGAVEDICG